MRLTRIKDGLNELVLNTYALSNMVFLISSISRIIFLTSHTSQWNLWPFLSFLFIFVPIHSSLILVPSLLLHLLLLLAVSEVVSPSSFLRNLEWEAHHAAYHPETVKRCVKFICQDGPFSNSLRSACSPYLLIVPSVALFEAAELLVQLHAVHLTQHASLSNLGTFFPTWPFGSSSMHEWLQT